MLTSLLKHKVERSDASHAILDEASRRRKAAKIAAVVSEYVNLDTARVLDIGTGSGHIAEEFAKLCKETVSVDVVDERKVKDGYEFVLAEDEKLPFPDRDFGVVISNHVVEHVPNQQNHFRELLRVVRTDGVIYLATPNKLWLRDPHYKLPFISWLPRRMSNWYLRRFNAGATWDIYPVSHQMLKRWLRQQPYSLTNALPALVKGESAKRLDTWGKTTRLLSLLPKWLLETTKFWSPTLIYVIRHNESSEK